MFTESFRNTVISRYLPSHYDILIFISQYYFATFIFIILFGSTLNIFFFFTVLRTVYNQTCHQIFPLPYTSLDMESVQELCLFLRRKTKSHEPFLYFQILGGL